MPLCSRVSLICDASRGVEAITEPAPFLEDRVSRNLVMRFLKCMAAVKMLQNKVFASMFERKLSCAVYMYLGDCCWLIVFLHFFN